MAFEALNHAGGMEPEPNLLVILNDNQMSISENVGGLTKMLGRLSSSRTLNALREGGKKLLGDKKKPPARFMRRWEEHWKGMFVPSTLFEQMGFHYTGPIDGHDVEALVGALKTLKTLKGPQLLHILTTKGKGYELAEGDQIGYHAVGPFDPEKGLISKTGAKKPTYTDVFGEWLCDMAAAEPKLLGITPAMREGSGLVRFSKEYPERYFDVAIADFRKEPLKPVDLECFNRTLDRIEFELPQMAARANAWAVGDVAALRSQPAEAQQLACLSAWFDTDVARKRGLTDLDVRVRETWLGQADLALRESRTTFATVGIGELLKPGGYLAQLQARGYTVEAPE